MGPEVSYGFLRDIMFRHERHCQEPQPLKLGPCLSPAHEGAQATALSEFLQGQGHLCVDRNVCWERAINKQEPHTLLFGNSHKRCTSFVRPAQLSQHLSG